ncbi:4-(cytidine 5'-diphospho)-2-C-methyl-D-erythritol kinase [Methylogaea oryzae]|uniref:4-(cytidine 5'-diphospho)-2-C-methyl-D-erythritol kinase n=1 Tax=Methylogaea oryzae TaxID=1295382 RepID=UPI003570A0C3
MGGNGAAWPAPGKLNLMLRIVGQRPDGYHLLQTVFQFIDLCDWLSFDVNDHGAVALANPLPGVPAEEDLTVRAARLLQAETGCGKGVTISVDKRLPMGGGLGGGSSDAATTLVALNHLWGLGLDAGRLQALGLGLGADVPVFVNGVAAWAEGVGEVLTPMNLPEPWFVVMAPDCHVATGKVFSAPNLTRNRVPIKIEDFPALWQGNDCLEIVSQMYPPVKAALDELGAFSEGAKLTGTGACVFAAFGSESVAEEAARALRGRWRLWVTKGLNRSPLLARLSERQGLEV